jgi:Phosphotransferase enzyme family
LRVRRARRSRSDHHGDVGSVSETVAAELSRSGVSDVERAVFGTDDPAAIDRLIGRFCEARFGDRPAGGVFYRSSVGCVTGVRLADGRRVVLKAYQDRWTKRFLEAVLAVQTHLDSLGFPCARPQGGPVPLQAHRANLVTVETWLDDPGMSADKRARARRASAAGLAGQIELCGDLRGLGGLDHHPLRRPVVGLYPEPHSPLFDFGRDAGSARWIDEFATRAVDIRDHSGDDVMVVAHTDWSARNVRLHEAAVVAVYDWDSLARVRESTAVGQAAATWSVTSEPGGSAFPSAAVVAAFIDDYEKAAGHPLGEAQVRAAGAAAVWTLAYTARCEHALAASGQARPDQHGAQDRLRADGETLLQLARA